MTTTTFSPLTARLTNSQISGDAAAAFTNTDWLDEQHTCTFTAEQASVIQRARSFLASHAKEDCPPAFVALHTFGCLTPTLDDAMEKADSYWTHGLSYLRVFEGRGIYLYLEHETNPEAWIEFALVNQNGDPV